MNETGCPWHDLPDPERVCYRCEHCNEWHCSLNYAGHVEFVWKGEPPTL